MKYHYLQHAQRQQVGRTHGYSLLFDIFISYLIKKSR